MAKRAHPASLADFEHRLGAVEQALATVVAVLRQRAVIPPAPKTGPKKKAIRMSPEDRRAFLVAKAAHARAARTAQIAETKATKKNIAAKADVKRKKR